MQTVTDIVGVLFTLGFVGLTLTLMAYGAIRLRQSVKMNQRHYDDEEELY